MTWHNWLEGADLTTLITQVWPRMSTNSTSAKSDSASSFLKVTSEGVMSVNHILGELTRVGGVEGYGCGCEEHACISCSPRDPVARPIHV